MNKTSTDDDQPRPWWQRWLKKRFSLCIDSRKELINELHHAQDKGLIANDSLGMIEGVLQIEKREVRDVMIPRSNITFLDKDQSFHSLLKKVLQTKHSRYPVYDETKDNVAGILLAKDLLDYIGNEASFDIMDVLIEHTWVPESQRLQSLLTDFRNSRRHMAVVYNEYSSVIGIVTIEDVLEQIVGEIDDEHDAIDSKQNITSRGASKYTLSAITPVEEFNDFFDVRMPTDQFDTIGGVIMNRMGKIPHQGEELQVDRFLFKIAQSDGRRILSIDMSVQPIVNQ